MKNLTSKNKQVLIICDNIRSLYNVGSIYRTSDGAGCVNMIYLTGMTGYPKNDPEWTQTLRITKTSLGAEKFVDWKYKKDPFKLVQNLKKNGTHIYTLENNISEKKPKNIFKTKFRFPMALVLGHEVRGVKDEIIKLSDQLIEIPMLGRKESLNVASAYAIAIYQISNQISLL